MPKPSSPNLPSPYVSSEVQTRLLGLLPFGNDDTGLLSGVVGPRSRYRQRISYAQAERLRAGVPSELRPYIYAETVPPSNPREEEYALYYTQAPVPIATRYSEGLQTAVETLADGSLKGRLVSGVLAITGRLSHTWIDDGKCIALESGVLLDKASAVHGLVHAVALLESNVSPNAQGYSLDVSLKSWGAEYVAQQAAGGLSIAREAVDNNPALFGDHATTVGLINAVADRLDRHRPSVDGQPVRAFPRIEA